MDRVACSCVALFAIAAGPPAVSGQSSPAHSSYHTIVEDYRGRDAGAVDRIAAIAEHDLLFMLVRVADLEWTPDVLRAAALLHTDAWVQLRTRRRGQAALHIRLAEQLLIAAATKAPAFEEFARRWYVVVSGLLHAYGDSSLSAELQDRSRARFPETVLQMNARAAFDAALAAETRAAAAGPISGRAPAAFIEALSPDAMQRLRWAALGYERALSIRPRFAEAALHLGRIRLIERRYDEAERWLAVASTSESLPTRYLAAMFRGALAERHGRYDDAEKHYGAASGLFRWGQSAPLALSHLLARTGRDAEARGALARHFAVTGHNVIEPLWTYAADPSAQLREGLDLLRAEVWR